MFADLAQHITSGSHHGSLPFHERCPQCRRERLLGQPNRGTTAPRLGLGLAAAAMMAAPVPAATASSPAPVVAPDQDSEGVPDADDETLQEPDPAALDPDGEDSSDAETSDPEVDGDEAGEGAGPLEEPSGPEVVDPGEIRADAPVPEAPPAAVPDVPPPSPNPVPQLREPAKLPPSPAGSPPPSGLDRRHQGESGGAPDRRQRGEQDPAERPTPKVDRDRGGGSRPPVEGPSPSPGVAAAPTAQDSAALVAPSRLTPLRSGPAATAPATHLIARGETLWSIASNRLGGHPSPAAVAREVQRIWDLNGDRLGTGSPDLILPGQTLRLR